MKTVSAVDTQSATPAIHSTRAKCYELLTLGDELLLGLATNTHLTFIGAELARRGVMLQRNVSVSDDAKVIQKQFAESWARADVVITTGGLGPTCDDRTREAIAEVLGQKLVHDESIEAAIRARFAAFNREMTPNNLKQAQRPERAEVLPNPNGTAPGLWVAQHGKVLCMLPGPPNELRPMFVADVLPRLERLGLVTHEEAYVQFRTIDVGDSYLETTLQPLFDAYGAHDANGAEDTQTLNVAYCAHVGAVDCRVSSPNGKHSRAQLEQLVQKCAALLGVNVLCIGHTSLPQVVGELLIQHNAQLAIAEDVTRGLLAQAFADVAHADAFFAGGLICRAAQPRNALFDLPNAHTTSPNDTANKRAECMAKNAAAQFGTTYALALTPSDDTPSSQSKNSRSALVIGLHTPQGTWHKAVSFPATQAAIYERARTAALDWLRRELLN